MKRKSEQGGPLLWIERRAGSAGRTQGDSLYFISDDADAMYNELTARGLNLAPPATACYGMKQLFLPEPDNYPLCFESPTDNWPG